MKKVLLLVAVISAFSFVSCKKDVTCTCTTVSTPSGGGTATTTVSTVTYNDARKGDAKSHCLNATATQDYMGTTVTHVRTCELK